ncbi:hypothetical protein B0H15DRAFT_860390 [Mycena belliarum]|uniref:Uncharacterized protein n=1 Tax=Mycena belliarum TaxID=1033014 RepID=A0AAD6XPC4_9AGAR|nr:hypothetical protein B0H15DRAFT_860390 [Mycena belliae]
MLSSSVLFPFALLCGLVRAGLTNYTIDDGNSAVVYSRTPVLQCSASTCPESWTSQLFNQTSTMTESPIIIAFTGSAIYVYLTMAGQCIFNIDGIDVGVFNNSGAAAAGNIQLAYSNTSVPDGDHIILISPAHANTLIEFDYAIYTAATNDAKHSARVRAIVAGVLSATVLVSGLITSAFLWRRHERERKFLLRGVRLVDADKLDKASIKMGHVPQQTSE